MKQKIDRLAIAGNLYVWKYSENSRNYPGLNISADFSAISNLIDLLELMINCEWSTKKVLECKIPTNVILSKPNNRKGTADFKSADHLILTLVKNKKSLWKTTFNDQKAELQFNEAKAIELRQSFLKLLERRNDFSICDEDDDHCLTFW